MSKVFRPWKTDEAWLLPRSVADFVPAASSVPKRFDDFNRIFAVDFGAVFLEKSYLVLRIPMMPAT